MKPFLRSARALLIWLLMLALTAAFIAGMADYKATSKTLHLTAGAFQGWPVPVLFVILLFYIGRARHRWPHVFASYDAAHRGYYYDEADEETAGEADLYAQAGVGFAERALNAEDLVCKIITHAQENPNGPGLIIPKFMLTEAEALVPDWRQRTTRPSERREQAEKLQALRPAEDAS